MKSIAINMGGHDLLNNVMNSCMCEKNYNLLKELLSENSHNYEKLTLINK